MQSANEFYEHLKSAIFKAYLAIEWDSEDSIAIFWERCTLCESEYNKAVHLWYKLSDKWPKQPSARVGWYVKRSVAEAGLLWLQDIMLAIRSVKAHDADNGPLSAVDFHALLVEALTKWHSLEREGRLTLGSDSGFGIGRQGGRSLDWFV